MNCMFRALAWVFLLLITSPAFATQPIPSDPIYMRLENGYRGFFARNDEYLVFSVIGNEVKPQDAYHIQVQAEPFLGIMLTFADKKQFSSSSNMLEAHRQWETEYWKKQAKRVEAKDRSDLASAKSGIMVTEFNIWGHKEDQFLTMYMVAIPTGDGVYAFSVTPTKTATDEFVKSFIGTIKLVHERFDILKEHQKLMSETDASKK